MATTIDKARDGDGDGKVYDGTPRERPTGPGDTVGRGRRSGGARSRPLVRGSRARSGRTRNATRPDGSFDTTTHLSRAEARRSRRGSVDSPIQVKSAKEALDLMEQGKHVVMDPDTVGVLLDKLAEIGQKAFAAEKAGTKFDAPNYNLCLIHVPDTNIFCEKNKGIPRIKMPQVKGKNIRPGSKAAALLKKQNADAGTPDNLEVDATAEFVAFLKSGGITISKGQTVDADKLKATQSELVGSKVGGMIGAHKTGKYDPSKDAIFVSEDNYVLDGHHRWAATVGAKYVEGENLTMTVDRINLPIQELVDLTNKFLEGFGILPNAASATSKSAPRELPCIGCGDTGLDESFRHRDLVAKRDWPAHTRMAGWNSDTSTGSGLASTSEGRTSAGRGPGRAARAGTGNSGSAARSSTSTGSLSKRQRGQKSSTVATTHRAATQPTSPSAPMPPTWPTTDARAGHGTTRLTESGTSASSIGSPQASTQTTSPVSSASATAPASTVSSAGSVVGKRSYDIPSPKSTPKEVAGSHNHKPAGTSILWPALYRELRKKGYSKAKAAAISNAKWNEKHGKGAKNAASTRVTKADEIEGVIAKTDDDKQLVYGWMYVTHNRDGEIVVDKSGDFIDEVDELDEAVVDFVLHERVGGVDHTRDGDSPVQASRLVESIVFTPEKIEALGLQPGDLPTGWWAGWKVDDPEVWQGVKSGRYKSFSIHGSGVREPVSADITKGYAVAGDIGGGGSQRTSHRTLSPAEIAQRKAAAIASAKKRRKGVGALARHLRARRAYKRSQRAGGDLAGITPSTPMSRRIDAVNRRNATRERIVRGRAKENDSLLLTTQRERVDEVIDYTRKLPPKERRRMLVKAKPTPTGTDRRRMAAAYTGAQVRGARSGTLSSKERKQRIDAARASANKRKGSGTKDKNPQTPETKAAERTRIRTETPGTPEHAGAMNRMKRAISSGRPLKVRQGEMDSVIERAKAQGLDYSESKGVVTITLTDGRKLMVTSTNNTKEK